MVTKSECIEIFNAMIRGTPISFNEKLLPLISEYLTEINYEKSNEMIQLIIQNPQLAQSTIPDIVNYYCSKFCILSIIFNLKTILNYE